MAQILVIDDEPEVIQIISEVLELVGHEVWTATTVEAAMLLFDAKPFDLVITDIMLPGDGGEEIIRQVLSRSANTKLMVISGIEQDQLKKRLENAKISPLISILRKPFSVHRLMEFVNTELNA